MDVLGDKLHIHLFQHGLGGVGLVEGLGLHHAGTDGGHLGTVVGADDGGHQMAAEGGTGHLQVTVVLKLGVVHINGRGGLEEGLVLLHIHVQVGAVGGQAGLQAGSHAGAQVAADVGGADEEHLGLLVLHQLADNLGVSVGGVVLQQGMVADINAVSAVAAQGLGVLLVDMVAQQHAAQLNAQVVGQLAALAEQLIAGAQDDAVTLLAEYPHALEGGGVFTIESHM